MKTAIKVFWKEGNDFYTGGIGGSVRTKWEVGEVKEVEGLPALCKNGFHYFREEDACFGVDFFGPDTYYAKVEILGEELSDTFKRCTNKIRLLKKPKKFSNLKLKRGYNSGDYNSGNHNSGDYNSGHHNSGNRNSGNRNSGQDNSGDYNSGDYNSGDSNSGHHNSGHHNSGNRNSGNRNSGHHNSGYHNSGHHNSGYHNSGNRNSGNYNSGNGYINSFCTETKYFLFDLEVSKDTHSRVMTAFARHHFDFNLKDKSYKECWKGCPEALIRELKKLPEFQTKEAKKKFFEITELQI